MIEGSLKSFKNSFERHESRVTGTELVTMLSPQWVSARIFPRRKLQLLVYGAHYVNE
jgi:hypothetical protein